MDMFASKQPEWADTSVHAMSLHCPQCRTPSIEAEAVWLNRRSPVYDNDRQRKWQEFYKCGCGCNWWAWSSDRPPNEYVDREPVNPVNPPSDWPRFFHRPQDW
jgi:hypothetical protein